MKRSLGQPPWHAKRDAFAAVAPERVALVPAERCCWLGGHAGQKPSPSNNRPKRTLRPAPPGVRTDSPHTPTRTCSSRLRLPSGRPVSGCSRPPKPSRRSPGSPPPRPQPARPRATRCADLPAVRNGVRGHLNSLPPPASPIHERPSSAQRMLRAAAAAAAAASASATSRRRHAQGDALRAAAFAHPDPMLVTGRVSCEGSPADVGADRTTTTNILRVHVSRNPENFGAPLPAV